MSDHSLSRSSSSSSGSSSSSSPGVLMLGNHKVTSLDDITKFSEMVSSNFQSLTDGRAEANEIQQGLKSEAEILAYTLDEKLTGLDRLRYFLFHNKATTLQRQVGLSSILGEVTVKKVGKRTAATVSTTMRDEDEENVHRSSHAASEYVANLATLGASTASSSTPPSTSSSTIIYTLSDTGDRLLDSILPDLHKCILTGQWEWTWHHQVSTMYTELIQTHVIPRSKLESTVAPFLMKMLDTPPGAVMNNSTGEGGGKGDGKGSGGGGGGGGNEKGGSDKNNNSANDRNGNANGSGANASSSEEQNEEYLNVWLPPLLACIEALGVPLPSSAAVTTAAPAIEQNNRAPAKGMMNQRANSITTSNNTSPPAAVPSFTSSPSPLLSTTLLDFSLKRGVQHLLSQPIYIRLMCVDIWSVLCNYLDMTTVKQKLMEPILSMCQDTSGAVRWRMCKALVQIIKCMRFTSSSSAASSTSTSSNNDSSSSPLSLLLIELEELLKDEERDVKYCAFYTLLATLDYFPSELRRLRIHPILRNMIQQPQKGQLLLIAAYLGEIVWKCRYDLVPGLVNPNESSENNGSTNTTSSNKDSLLSNTQLIKTILTFYKNLPFLSPAALVGAENVALLDARFGGGGGGGLVNSLSSSSSSSSLLSSSSTPSSSNLSSGLGSSGPSTTSTSSSAAALSAEPRKYCAMNFVAILSILGRVPSMTTPLTTSSSSSSAHQQPIPESRFFLDHFSTIWLKLLKDDEEEIRNLMAQCFWEVVQCLHGGGTSLIPPTVSGSGGAQQPAVTSTSSKSSSSSSQSLSNLSAFKLTKDAFLGLLHEASNAPSSTSSGASGTSSASSNGIPGSSSLQLARSSTAPSSSSSSSASTNLTSTSPSPSTSLTSPSESIQYLIEGGKLEVIVNTYFQCHFQSYGGVIWNPPAGSGSHSGSINAYGTISSLSSSSSSFPQPTESLLDSWSGFMHDLLRSLITYESSLNLIPSWRLKKRVLRSMKFLLRSTNQAVVKNSAASVVPAAASAVSAAASSSHPPSSSPSIRPSGHYFGSILGLHTVGDLNNYSLLWEKLLPCLVQHMHLSAVPLKLIAGELYIECMLSTPFAIRRAEAHARFVREFATSRSYGDRMVFVEIMKKCLGLKEEEGINTSSHASTLSAAYHPSTTSLLSNRLFKKLFLLPLLTLIHDPVINLRRKFITSPGLLQTCKKLITNSSNESMLQESFLRAVNQARGMLGMGQEDKVIAQVYQQLIDEPFDAPIVIDVNGGNAGATVSATNNGKSSNSTTSRGGGGNNNNNNAAAAAAIPSPPSPSYLHNLHLEEHEDSLLRLEELWLLDEKHRSALTMSGGNISLSSAGIAQGGNYTPLDNRSGGGGGGGGGNSNGTSGSNTNGNNMNSGTTSGNQTNSLTTNTNNNGGTSQDNSNTNNTNKKLARRGSGSMSNNNNGTISMKSLNDALDNNGGNSDKPNSSSNNNNNLSAATSGNAMVRRKSTSVNPDSKSQSTAGANSKNPSSSANSSGLTSVSQATALAASRVAAAANKHKIKTTNNLLVPGSLLMETNATSTTTGAGGQQQPNSAGLLGSSTNALSLPKGVKRYGSAASVLGSGGTAGQNGSSGNTSGNGMSINTSNPSNNSGTSSSLLPNARPNRGGYDLLPSANGSSSYKDDDSKYSPTSLYADERDSPTGVNAQRATSAVGSGRVRPSGLGGVGNSTGTGASSGNALAPTTRTTSKLLSANLSLSAARIVATSGVGGVGGPNGSTPLLTSSPPSASTILTRAANLANSNAANSGGAGGSVPGLIRAGSPATMTRQRPSISSRTSSALGTNSTTVNSSGGGGATDRDRDRDYSSQTPPPIVPNNFDSSPLAGRRSASSRSSPNSVPLPKLDSPPVVGSGNGGAYSTNINAGGTNNTNPLTNPQSQQHPISSTKLYSKEPPAHAHMRKFKLSQRSQLPTAELLRSEASSLAKGDSDSLSGGGGHGAHGVGGTGGLIGHTGSGSTLGAMHGRRRSGERNGMSGIQSTLAGLHAR